MNRYNKLKLKTLTAFEFAKDQWLGPGEVAERIGLCPLARHGHTLRDCGDLVCWKGVPQVRGRCNTALVRVE